MAQRPKPACMTAAPEDAAVLASILFGTNEETKTGARNQVSRITVLWQHWSPRLKSAIRSDVAALVPEGSDITLAVAGGYSDRLVRVVMRDIGRM
jgi:hypothetical protein